MGQAFCPEKMKGDGLILIALWFAGLADFGPALFFRRLTNLFGSPALLFSFLFTSRHRLPHLSCFNGVGL